jgi:hypothetical protein
MSRALGPVHEDAGLSALRAAQAFRHAGLTKPAGEETEPKLTLIDIAEKPSRRRMRVRDEIVLEIPAHRSAVRSDPWMKRRADSLGRAAARVDAAGRRFPARGASARLRQLAAAVAAGNRVGIGLFDQPDRPTADVIAALRREFAADELWLLDDPRSWSQIDAKREVAVVMPGRVRLGDSLPRTYPAGTATADARRDLIDIYTRPVTIIVPIRVDEIRVFDGARIGTRPPASDARDRVC